MTTIDQPAIGFKVIVGGGVAAMLASVVAVTPLLAQTQPVVPARTDIEQLDVPDEAPIDQISSGSRDLIQGRSAPRSSAAPAQLSAEDDADPTPVQLTGERGAAPNSQLNPGGKTAAAPDALSKPADGRVGAIARVEGEDRCDPAEAEAAGRVCERVIETRAAEFARPAQGVLSAEQRLLIDQRLREGPADTRTAARRLGTTGFDPNSLEEQGIASVAMRGGPQGPAPADDREDPAAAAIDPAVQAILGMLNATPPPQ